MWLVISLTLPQLFQQPRNGIRNCNNCKTRIIHKILFFLSYPKKTKMNLNRSFVYMFDCLFVNKKKRISKRKKKFSKFNSLYLIVKCLFPFLFSFFLSLFFFFFFSPFPFLFRFHPAYIEKKQNKR